jgi:hypothetical protein
MDSETLRAIRPADLSDDELKEHVRNLIELVDQTQANLLALVGEFDSRGTWAIDGEVDARSWLAHHNDLSSSEAGRLLKRARSERRK